MATRSSKLPTFGTSIVLAASVLNFQEEFDAIGKRQGQQKREMLLQSYVRNHRIEDQADAMLQNLRDDVLDLVLKADEKKIVVTTPEQLDFVLGSYSQNRAGTKAKGDPFLAPLIAMKKAPKLSAEQLLSVCDINPKKLLAKVECGEISASIADKIKNPDFVPGTTQSIDCLTCEPVKAAIDSAA